MTEPELEPTEQTVSEAAVPAAERRPRAVLAPEEALDRLRRGQTLQDVQVEKLCFQADFPLPFKLKNCLLIRPRFEGATFRGDVAFLGCTLERPQCSRETHFAAGLSLAGSTIAAGRFNKFTLQGTLNCERIRTRGSFDLVNCQFTGPVRFWEAHFDGWFNLKGCDFAADADFRSLHAQRGFVLNACRFHAAALFRGASITLKCDLASSRFEGLLDFSKAKLHDYVYLEGVEQGDRQRFAFANTLGERVLVRPAQLQGRLASEEAGEHTQAMHEYAFLKRSYGALHRYDDEDWALYRFRVSQRRCSARSWWRPWTKVGQFFDWLLLDQGCGYCTNPMRAVRSALVIMLAFGLLYMAGIDHFYVDAAKRPFPDQELGSGPNRVLIGLLTSVSVFTSGFSGIREMARGWMNLPLILESLLGTLLWGLFIVAFSRKVIR
jgi:hypothetical protein